MMKTLNYFLGIYYFAVVLCSEKEADKDTSKTNSPFEDEKTVENIMTMIQDTCTRNSWRKTVKQLQKDSKETCTSFRPRDCTEVRTRKKKSAVYTIYPDISKGSKGVQAYCDMTTDGGGWTVIQKRIDGSVKFNRKWKEYEKGFGNATGEYWLGNSNIHHLTSNGHYKLRVDMVDSSGNNKYAVYSTFKVGDAASKYKLTVGGYSGDAGEKLSYHNGRTFSTYDQDNDANKGNCAEFNSGGWWFWNCFTSFFNGQYKGKIYWGYPSYVKTSTMMIKNL